MDYLEAFQQSIYAHHDGRMLMRLGNAAEATRAFLYEYDLLTRTICSKNNLDLNALLSEKGGFRPEEMFDMKGAMLNVQYGSDRPLQWRDLLRIEIRYEITFKPDAPMEMCLVFARLIHDMVSLLNMDKSARISDLAPMLFVVYQQALKSGRPQYQDIPQRKPSQVPIEEKQLLALFRALEQFANLEMGPDIVAYQQYMLAEPYLEELSRSPFRPNMNSLPGWSQTEAFAHTYLGAAFMLADLIGMADLKTTTLRHIAWVHMHQFNLRFAEECCRRAIAMHQKLNRVSDEYRACLGLLAEIQEWKADTKEELKARQDYADQLLMDVSYHADAVSLARLKTAEVAFDTGDYAQATQELRTAMRTVALAPFDGRSPSAYLILEGRVLQEQGDFDGALERYQKALSIVSQCDEAQITSVFEAGVFCRIAELFRLKGEIGKALRHAMTALTLIREEVFDPRLPTPKKRPRASKTALPLEMDSTKPEGQDEWAVWLTNQERYAVPASLVLTDLGEGFIDLGDMPLALRCLKQANLIQHIYDNESLDHARTLLLLGTMDPEVNPEYGFDLPTAIAVWDKRSPDTLTHGNALSRIAVFMADYCALWISQGVMTPDRQQALLTEAKAQAARSYRILESHQSLSRSMAESCYAMARVCRLEKKDPEAHQYLQRGLEIVQRAAPWSYTHYLLLSELGGLCAQQPDRRQEAEGYLYHALDVAESSRDTVSATTSRDLLFARYQRAFDTLIALLSGEPGTEATEKAFAIAERSRARTLGEMMQGRQAGDPSSQTNISPALDPLLQTRDMQYRHLNKVLSTDPGNQAVLDNIEMEIRLLDEEIANRGPGAATTDRPVTVSLEQLQKTLLPSDTMILEYAVTGETLYVWAIRQKDILFKQESIPMAELTALLGLAVDRHYLEPELDILRLRNRQAPSERLETVIEHLDVTLDELQDQEPLALEELSCRLLGQIPVEFWQGVHQLIIVPDGALHLLPFEILPFEGKTLCDTFATLYAPSSTTLWNIENRRHDREGYQHEGEFIGFALDDEQNAAYNARAKEEVEGIAGKFAGRSSCPSATERNVLEKSGGYRYVHFATHGLYDERNPLFCGLRLNEPASEDQEEYDAILQVHELSRLSLSADLVVCSACETGLGKHRDGEGIVGLSRGLLAAGAKCLLVSLWKVPGKQTKDYMLAFYDALAKGSSMLEALKIAREQTRQRWPDTHDWAAFVLVGLPNSLQHGASD